MQYHTKTQKSFIGRFLSEFAIKWLLRIPPHFAYVATLPCPMCIFFAHSVYIQLCSLEMQLCRILTDLIVLLCVHNEWPINRIPDVHVVISGLSFIISKVSRQLVHRSSCDCLTHGRIYSCSHGSADRSAVGMEIPTGMGMRCVWE